MPGKDPQSLKAVNNNGFFNFSSNADLLIDGGRLHLNCTDQYFIEASTDSVIRNSTGNANVEVIVDHLNLKSGKENSNASIFLTAYSDTGGIKLDAGTGGITQYATGNVDINAKNSDINIGVFAQGITTDQTNNVIIESNDTITATTTDFTVVTSDTIELISLVGDIRIGTSASSSILRFENENILINQNTSTLDRQLDIKITDQASSSPGYNGIVINSSNSSVAPDLRLQTSDSNASISIGVEPLSSKYSSFKEYIAMQTGTTIVPIYGPEFTSADIGRRVYWTITDETDTIQSLGKTILTANNTYATTNLTTSGTYTGNESRLYRIEIDSIGSTDTFRWSRDAGKTYIETYKNTSTSAITLENGIQITFAASTGHREGEYWTFHTKITAIVSTSRSIVNSEKLQMLQEFSGYIRTSNISDIQISTAGNERMRITADGSVGIGTHIPTATLDISNNIGKSILLNEYDTNYQINPSVASLKFGGYVAVWESKVQDGDDYGVYVQQLTADGAKFGSQMKVNITTAGHQSNPHIAGRNTTNSRDFVVVWASEESDGSGVYDIYANVYINGNRLKAADVLVNSATSSNKQLHPRAVGLTDGTYLIVWSSDDSNSGDYNIYGRIMNNAGTLVGSRFQVTSTSDSYSVIHPYPFSISSDDATIPGGYGVVFMNEYESTNTGGGAVNDDDRYNIQYRLFNSSGTAYTVSDVDVTEAGDRITLSDGLVSGIGLSSGGFALSFYRNYEGKSSLYAIGNAVSGETSDVSGTISSVSTNVLNIQGLTATDRFIVGEVITIENHWKEKIYKVTHDGGGNATITLSTQHKQISLYKYATSSTTSVLNNIQVNTSILVADAERNNTSGVDNTRSDSIFVYKRPFSPISELDNGSFLVAWTSGAIPSIYYQVINSTTGELVGPERKVDTKYSALKQRNVSITGVKTMEGYDGGVAMVWDLETLDTDASGVYQTIIHPNVPIFRVRNELTDFSLSQYGDLGIGVNNPEDRLHIRSNNETSNIIIQNNSSNIQTLTTSRGITNLIFKDQDNITGIIKSGHSNNYQKLNPNYDNLVSYYPFDESLGSNALSDLSKNKYDGRIENFDVYTDWQTSNGKVNGSLDFNGSNNYIDLSANSDLNSLATGSGGYTISGWVKLPKYITTSANLDVICNGGNLSTEGTYLFSISDLGSNGSAYLTSSLTTSSGLQISNGSTTSLNDGNWHMVTNVYHNSNTALENYLDGSFNSGSIITGTISSVPTSNVYIGSRNSTSGFFRGNMDELRIYNTAFTREEISELYRYGDESLGKMTFSVQGGNNTWNDTTYGFTLDDTGRVQGFQAKSHPFVRVAGTTTTISSGVSVSGNGTQFRKDLQTGDTIVVSSNELVITKIKNDTSMNVDRKSADTLTTKMIRKPSIVSFFDINDNLKGLMDYRGNMIIGSGQPASLLEIKGSGSSSNDLPYLNLTNTTEGDSEGSRETRVIFRGTNQETAHELGYISVSHSGTGDDIRGKMKLSVNDGTNIVEAIRIKHDSNVGIGNIDPQGILHVEDPQDCEFVLQAGGDEEKKFGAPSAIYFVGSNGSLDSNGLNGSFGRIQGSSDHDSINVSGRIDLFTNDNIQNEGMQNRMSVLSNGRVGIGISEPQNIFHVGPKATLTDGTTGSQSGTTITLNNNFTDTNAIGGVVVFNNNIQTSRKIVAMPSLNTITTDTSATVDSASVTVHFGGLVVDSTAGNVAIGSYTPTINKLHIEGCLGTAISTKTADYTLTLNDSTILGDSSSNSVTITLPEASGLRGRQYTVKRINAGSDNVTVATTSGTIDGSSSVNLTAQYKYLTCQTDGSSNWYIISTNV